MWIGQCPPLHLFSGLVFVQSLLSTSRELSLHNFAVQNLHARAKRANVFLLLISGLAISLSRLVSWSLPSILWPCRISPVHALFLRVRMYLHGFRNLKRAVHGNFAYAFFCRSEQVQASGNRRPSLGAFARIAGVVFLGSKSNWACAVTSLRLCRLRVASG